ncbi:hypothetical protein FN846DRAFT_789115 [Sphaerosporella brunnea]|uniref:Uncharacterized protein n=1 Tax=Sphaerosporella brunnea TaxID=1250544 RepID=A0A5J5EBI1_9PEZI|nr:hypothetical protein FN846DRAFT_789115 [Sphaerosporella brunnea]
MLSFTAAAATLLSTLLSLANAHMGMFHPSVLDFDGNGYDLVTPLSNLPFEQWWFHGDLNKPTPTSSFPLPAGGTVTVELACNKEFTSYGDSGDGEDACPTDVASYHAGDPIDDAQLMGCALAIAYESSFAAVKPEEFVVFSVNRRCVSALRTEFAVPQTMRMCPQAGCICAWFWQGQDSADEMYMNGFRCHVTGGQASATPIADPKPPRWCPDGGCVEGPKQPMYWANKQSNIAFSGEYAKKPSYNMKWGFRDGAQEIFSAGVAGGKVEGSSSEAYAPTKTVGPSGTSLETTAFVSTGVPTTFSIVTKTSGQEEMLSETYPPALPVSTPPGKSVPVNH